MRVLEEKLRYKNVGVIIINEVDIYNLKHLKSIIDVLIFLMQKNKFFFEFYRVDNFFNEDDYIEQYKYYLPKFLNENGKYEIIEYKDDIRFSAIAILQMNSILKEFQNIWKYYDEVLFFEPNEECIWENYKCICFKLKPIFYGIGYIKNKYTDITFTKGHDSDVFIISFNKEKYNTEKLKFNIQTIINKNLALE